MWLHLRGGSWVRGPENVQVSNRDGDVPSTQFSYGGFRCVMEEHSPGMLRGGSWFDIQDHARADYRSYYPPNDRYYNLGFRVVREL